jgi:nitrogen regulatory protein P-II 2
MKLVTGIINTFKLDEVFTSLVNLSVQDINVIEVKGYGQQKGLKEHYRGALYEVNFLKKVKFEFTVSNDALPEVIEAIKTSASTGHIGDGKIFVYDL